MKKNESKFKKLSQSVLRFGIELLIVFAGVYGAFLLSEYKESRQEAERRVQIFDALLREISGVSKNAHRVAEDLSKFKAIYDSLIAESKMPRLAPFTNPITFTPHVWNATIQSDGLNLLEVSTIEELSGFYNSTQQLIQLIEEFRERTVLFIMPNLDKENDEFYDLQTKKLRRKYFWYLDGFEDIAQKSTSLAAEADSLVIFINQGKNNR